MQVQVIGGTLCYKEQQAYLDIIKNKHPEQIIKSATFKVDGDFVDVEYEYDVVPFIRIRRITGYLVGSLERFNNAKLAEVKDRVVHNSD